MSFDRFDRVVCINLDRGPEGWVQFQENFGPQWPFGDVERFPAIDGQRCPAPDWFRGGPGAYGCNLSHTRVIEDCLNRGIKNVLIFEDDAVARPDMPERWERFKNALPDDWEVIYLGGQHIYAHIQLPQLVVPETYRPFNVNRTHAWAIRGEGLIKVYRHLMHWTSYDQAGKYQIIDHHMGKLVSAGSVSAYCPPDWLFDQRAGYSEIHNSEKAGVIWQGAEKLVQSAPAPVEGQDRRIYGGTTMDVNRRISAPKLRSRRRGTRRRQSPQEKTTPIPSSKLPFVAVVGIHSSGSSCLAGVLYHLGVHMGNEFCGYYGRDPKKSCGFEATGLAAIMNRCVPWPAIGIRQPERLLTTLRQWIHDRQHEAEAERTIAGGKEPRLSAIGDILEAACGKNLIVIDSHRALEESIASFVNRESRRHLPKQLERHQRWLWDCKQDFLARHPDHLRVDYGELVTDPASQISRIMEYLKIGHTCEQVEEAVAWVDRNKRHFELETSPPDGN